MRDELEALYRACREEMYKTAFGVLRNHHEAEDAVQVVFARLVMRPDRTIGRVNPQARRAYLVSAVRNVAISVLRSRRRLVDVDTSAVDVPDGKLSPMQTAGRNAALRILDSMIARLPVRCAEVMRIIWLEGLSHTEIAARLGISTNAVEKQVARARRRLREMAEWPEVRDWVWLWTGLSSEEDGGGLPTRSQGFH
ncbi:MAG TPA: sigma-70 family RNA polymerase sigma factor, partial [Longimicrobiales bacterium]|nr:sigma-70 family RNA polymerase sigma factor [Longimicrobiales bacterium]